jgi:endonuclease/exonuclease/phosphatase family metal-dependent hydrolase
MTTHERFGMSPVRRGTELSVATWNVCLGVDFEPILGAGRQHSLKEAARLVLDGVRATRFPDRAEAIARIVARHRPDVLALQELGKWETGGTGEGRLLYSFPEIMQVALARAGAPYVLVTCVDTVTGQLPVDGRTWASFTSCDALFVRQDVDVNLSVVEVDHGHYDSSLTAGGGRMPIRRGWSSLDLERGGRKVRVVVTHLDSMDTSVRRDQMHELVAMACRSQEPVVILGDLNTPAAPITGPSRLTASSKDGVLEILAGAGFADAWVRCREHRREAARVSPQQTGAVTTGSPTPSAAPGGTWGPAPGLLASKRRDRTLTQRLDYVFYDPAGLEARDATVIGGGPEDVTRTVPTLLPSDHAGVLVHLRLRADSRG